MRIAGFLLAALLLTSSVSMSQDKQDTKPAVPVFQPGNDVKESTTLPTPTPMPKVVPKTPTPKPLVKKDDKKVKVRPADDDTAALPLTFVKNRIETMPVGTKGFVAVTDVRIDSNRKCYLHPDGIYGSNAEGRVVQVVKEEGGYGLILDKDVNHQWVAEELPEDVQWLPVKTVTSK